MNALLCHGYGVEARGIGQSEVSRDGSSLFLIVGKKKVKASANHQPRSETQYAVTSFGRIDRGETASSLKWSEDLTEIWPDENIPQLPG